MFKGCKIKRKKIINIHSDVSLFHFRRFQLSHVPRLLLKLQWSAHTIKPRPTWQTREALLPLLPQTPDCGKASTESTPLDTWNHKVDNLTEAFLPQSPVCSFPELCVHLMEGSALSLNVWETDILHWNNHKIWQEEPTAAATFPTVFTSGHQRKHEWRVCSWRLKAEASRKCR